MFSSISRILAGQSPPKSSYPGPARPDYEDTTDRIFPSTAPAEYPDGIEDHHLTDMAAQHWGQDSIMGSPIAPDVDEGPDEIPDGITDYVDPFSSMQPFSTQPLSDEEEAAPAQLSSEYDDEKKKKKKGKKGTDVDENKTHSKKAKNKTRSADFEQSGQALPTPTTSNEENASASQKKKKRKREPMNSTESSEAHDSARKKKRKNRTTLHDIEDVDVEHLPEGTVSDSPITSVRDDAEDASPARKRNPALDSILKSDPQRSYLGGVSKQLFDQPSDTPAIDAKDDETPVSLSSPSVAAQRRRSMSRGSQISVLRQSLAREVASQPDRISEAAESADEAMDENEGSALDPEESSDALQHSASASQQDHDETDGQGNGSDEDADMADVSNGAVANNLPPSSQPPRKDVSNSIVDDELAVEEPQLPIRTFRDALNNSAKKQAAHAKMAISEREKPVATPRASRRRNVEDDAYNSDTGNVPSSAQKSARSTASKRQRPKPDFFEHAPKSRFTVENQEAEANLDVDDAQNAKENLAALSELPSAEATEPRKKQKKSRKPATARASTAAHLATPKTNATKRTASQKAAAPHPDSEQFLTGQFSVDEMRMLSEAVEKYRDEHGLSQKEMNDRIQMKNRKKAEKSNRAKGLEFDSQQFQDMWAAICAGVPNRRRQKIIDVARQEFHNFKARGGGWTTQEDARLEELHTKHEGSWVKIADEMNRHPNDVRDRYRNYVICGGIETRMKWTEEEERELVEHVVASLRRIDRSPGNSRKSPLSLLNWQSISELMGHRRSRLQCAKKFKTLNVELSPTEVLRCSRPSSTVTWTLEKARKQIREMPPEDKYEMVNAILAGAARSDRDIRWAKLVDLQFRQKWPKPTLKLLWHRLKRQVPDYEEKTVRDCSRWLLEDAEANGLRGVKFLDGGHADGDSEDELMVVNPPKKQQGPSRRGKKRKDRSEEMVVDSDSAEDDETRLANTDSPSAQQQPSSAASHRSTPRLAYAPESTPRATPRNLRPATTRDRTRLAPSESEGVKPSPAKKRVRLSGSRSARQHSLEEEGAPSEPMTSQYAVKDIPDRLKEKKEATRRRISSGSRLRSTASLQPESVQNSDMDEDMPPIHVPPSTQPPSRQSYIFNVPPGTWARKTGNNILPGLPVEEGAEKSMSDLEASSGETPEVENNTPVDVAASVAITKPHEKKDRRMKTRVAKSPT
ncbi:Myb-like DNA-binding domain-containing protein [Colletotrichum higginsianum IMI 349063]|uniref:Myb-like DNA-binding domain-containing protein n=1 Tax=Colletotrichum higginsianum (strain IMI 349063) TaxID=759273 RepID=A0A1B7Y0L2_COLHI|nr:Myb-like DNA-binding domain-containing protein [Colletotrichum higginsianum IMI 349063]OBR05561.1 Myb-like DNA-binding domain-containing protein [Colletotrichum higginsianum IMI 349063]